MTPDYSKYAEITEDNRIAVRGSVDEDYPTARNYYAGEGWRPSGWMPQMAREFAAYIQTLADEAETRERLPKAGQPRVGDVWKINGTEYHVLGSSGAPSELFFWEASADRVRNGKHLHDIPGWREGVILYRQKR